MGPWDVRVGPLAVGAGAVWVGTRRGTVTVRVDPVGLRVTARFGATRWRWPMGCCGPIAAGAGTR
jgi:hypothetical protein